MNQGCPSVESLEIRRVLSALPLLSPTGLVSAPGAEPIQTAATQVIDRTVAPEVTLASVVVRVEVAPDAPAASLPQVPASADASASSVNNSPLLEVELDAGASAAPVELSLDVTPGAGTADAPQLIIDVSADASTSPTAAPDATATFELGDDSADAAPLPILVTLDLTDATNASPIEVDLGASGQAALTSLLDLTLNFDIVDNVQLLQIDLSSESGTTVQSSSSESSATFVSTPIEGGGSASDVTVTIDISVTPETILIEIVVTGPSSGSSLMLSAVPNILRNDTIPGAPAAPPTFVDLPGEVRSHAIRAANDPPESRKPERDTASSMSTLGDTDLVAALKCAFGDSRGAGAQDGVHATPAMSVSANTFATVWAALAQGDGAMPLADLATDGAGLDDAITAFLTALDDLANDLAQVIAQQPLWFWLLSAGAAGSLVYWRLHRRGRSTAPAADDDESPAAWLPGQPPCVLV